MSNWPEFSPLQKQVASQLKGEPRPPREGYRWVKGVFTQIIPPEQYDAPKPHKSIVADCCGLCFTRRHFPSDCPLPEWFEVPTHLVD